MAQTSIEKLKRQLEEAVIELKKFDDFRSVVNHDLVALVWDSKNDRETVKVAVLDYTGHFYRGWIEGRSTSSEGSWDILADDGELISGVSATSFVAVRLEGS